MLEIMRQGAQSWGIKLLFGIIIAVFVFAFGMGGMQTDKHSTLATVNDQPIKVNEFIRAYERSVQAARQQNPQLTSEMLEQMQFKDQVFGRLVNSALLKAEAERLGIQVSIEEVRREITAIPAFQNEQQTFDRERYQSVLSANSLNPAEFEEQFRHNLLMQKFEEYLSLPARVTEQEARDYFEFTRETATVNYVPFNLETYKDAVTITPEQVQAYYDEHPEEFTIPAKARIDMLVLTPEGLAPTRSVTPEEISAYYEAHSSQFKQEEQVRAGHILLELAEDAPEEQEKGVLQKISTIRTEIEQGTPFAEAARKYSEGPSATSGGDLGWFARGRMVPGFEEAAFALEPGEISEPVRTEFGYHLIRIEDRRAAGSKKLDEVSQEIKTILAREKASEAITDLLDSALEQLLTGSDLTTTAEKLGLSLETSDFFTKQAGPAGLELAPEDKATLFALADGEPTQEPILMDTGYLLAQKVDDKPSVLKPLEEVRAAIEERLTLSRARDKAREAARTTLAGIKAKRDVLPEELQARMKTSTPFSRQGFIQELGMQPDLAEAAFTSAPGTWLETPYETQDGAVLVSLKELIPPKDEDWEAQKQFWMASLEQNRKQELFRSVIQDLRDKAEVVILNGDVLKN
ncbi:MAG TPA: SurA N-terminal domain-containing protein [Desulfomicrobiaceae bacterium]|nr:SurA N-terminal domain-containing protein [Desulfomicrobiaceae bacterium]